MNFALLGTDSEILQLAQAAIAAGHQITWCGDLGEDLELSEFFGEIPADQGDQWETLYDQDACDAVLVGRGNAAASLRAEQINQLAKNGIALLTSFPVVDSVLNFYEIDMARNESGSVLHHFNPLIEQEQLLEDCSDWVRQQHPLLGAIEQMVWRRPLATRTREQALWHFARDVELLDLIDGRLTRLGALGSPAVQSTYAGLSVQLLGKSNVPVRWEVEPVGQASGPQLTLIAEHGSLAVTFNENDQAVQMQTSFADSTETMSLEPSDAAAVAIERFTTALETKQEPTTWPAALHAMELADTIEISLRRGRMIDVHHQQLTEQMAFKGTMSALGCGILMVLPPLLLFIGWLAELAGLPVASYWPHALLLLLAIFLLFQFLPKLLLPSSNDLPPS